MDVLKIQEAKTKIIGKQICYREEIESTHIKSKQIVKKLNEEDNGTILIADKQSSGVGTKGRKWYTGSEKNIAMTIILMPKCNIEKLESLTLKIAESMKETIKDLYDIQLDIKYPNDLMCNGKKVSGILTESVTNKEVVKYIFIGIGIDVNQIIFTPEIEQIATSLKKEYNKEFNREEIISSFFNIFEKEYKKLIN